MPASERSEPVGLDEQLRAVGAAIDQMKSVTDALHRSLWQEIVIRGGLPQFGEFGGFPTEIADLLKKVGDTIEATESAAKEAFERFCAGPSRKVLAGQMLTQEEFAFAKATGVIGDQRRNDLTDYQLFCMFYYEDDSHFGYINPEETPNRILPGKIGIRFGIVPESVRVKFLRPDQEEFLRTRLPDLYARFLQEECS